MTVEEIKKRWRRYKNGENEAIVWFENNHSDLVDLLLDCTMALKLEVEEQKLVPKNSYMADVLEELELEQWIEIPQKI